MWKKSVRQLTEGVRQAFWGVAYPGDDALLVEDSFDCLELEKLQSQEWNSHWAKVPDEMIEWHANSLAFLSPEAYRFYLPAFILYTLQKPEATSPVLPYLIYDLLATAEGKRACHRRRIAVMSPEQKRAVLDFLKYVRDELKDVMCVQEAAAAIAIHWGCYEMK
jgi:hypothetical protein